MLPERRKHDADFQGTAGRTSEGSEGLLDTGGLMKEQMERLLGTRSGFQNLHSINLIEKCRQRFERWQKNFHIAASIS